VKKIKKRKERAIEKSPREASGKRLKKDQRKKRFRVVAGFSGRPQV
jgi:hypothetical protein